MLFVIMLTNALEQIELVPNLIEMAVILISPDWLSWEFLSSWISRLINVPIGLIWKRIEIFLW